MAKAKAIPSQRTSRRDMPKVTGIEAKRARRRPYEYDHQYGLRAEAVTKPGRGAATPRTSPRRANTAKAKGTAKKR